MSCFNTRLHDYHLTINPLQNPNAKVTACLEDFIDFGAGTCSFNSLGFISLLESTARFYPANADYDVLFTDFNAGNPVLVSDCLGSFGNESSTIFESFLGGEITYIGYPTLDGNGCSRFVFNDRISISNESDNKDAAWAFVKYILTDYQKLKLLPALPGTPPNPGHFPVKLSVLDKLAYENLAYYASSSDGGVIEEIWSADMSTKLADIWIRAVNQSDVNKILELIDSTYTYRLYEFTILPIIMEDAAAYFAGHMTAQAAASAIQSKVSIFLAEQN